LEINCIYTPLPRLAEFGLLV